MNSLVKSLPYYRKRAGLTQEELASLMDTTALTIGRWERGERNPSIRKLNKLADVLDTEVKDLLGNPPQPSLPKEDSRQKRAKKKAA